MMAEMHPDELELLAYVEGELDDARRAGVASHVESCARCAGEVEAVERARMLLREAPLLELPAERRDAIASGLTAPARSGRRVLTLVAPIAAALALAGGVAVVATQGGGGDGASEVSAGKVQEGAGEAESGEDGAAGGEAASAPPQAFVSGPAEEVAAKLRERGFRASVRDGAVVVRGAPLARVRKALADLQPGDVAVYVR